MREVDVVCAAGTQIGRIGGAVACVRRDELAALVMREGERGGDCDEQDGDEQVADEPESFWRAI